MNYNVGVIQPLPGIGDVFWFDQALQSLSHHISAPLILITKPLSYADLLYQDSSYVKEVLFVQRPGKHSGFFGFLKLAYLLRQKKFSEVWIFHKSWRYVWASRLAGIPKIVRYPSQKEWLEKHPIDRVHDLLKKQGVSILHNPIFSINEDAEKRVCKKLNSHKKPWVAIGIGGSEPSKKWASDHWEDIAVWLFKEKQMTVFFLGGKKEAIEACQMVHNVEKRGGKAYALTDLILPESLAFLSLTAFFIGNDTGMMNASAVLMKPTLGIFLSSPCLSYRTSLRGVTKKTNKTEISVEEVMRATEEFLLPYY